MSSDSSRVSHARGVSCSCNGKNPGSTEGPHEVNGDTLDSTPSPCRWPCPAAARHPRRLCRPMAGAVLLSQGQHAGYHRRHRLQRPAAKFRKAGAVVLGVSRDSVKSHDNFCAKQGFNFRWSAMATKRCAAPYDQDEEHVRQAGTWHRTQHLLSFPRQPHRAVLAQGQGCRPCRCRSRRTEGLPVK